MSRLGAAAALTDTGHIDHRVTHFVGASGGAGVAAACASGLLAAPSPSPRNGGHGPGDGNALDRARTLNEAFKGLAAAWTRGFLGTDRVASFCAAMLGGGGGTGGGSDGPATARNSRPCGHTSALGSCTNAVLQGGP